MKELMKFYWLRPETAIWRARDIEVLNGIEFEEPSLDLCCGDGVYSFIRAGGELSDEYDAFIDITNTEDFFEGDDIYTQEKDNNLDVFTKSPAKYKFTVGFDWKQGLLNKANRLDLYRKLIQGDANNKLPFDDEEFKTVFSNASYWMSNIRGLLSEMQRITMKDGTVIMSVPDEAFLDYSFYNKYSSNDGIKNIDFLKLLDRGRCASNFQVVRSKSEWISLFNDAGLEVVSHKGYLSGATLKIWDIGLRPFSPALIDMANSLSLNDRLRIKKKWVDESLPLLEGFLDSQDFFENMENPGFHLFVLKKK
jgi:SAM-dependent methyltransferase